MALRPTSPGGSLLDRLRSLDRATAEIDGPFAVIDRQALDTNADDLVRRASGVPVRVASKSVRVRWVLEHVLGHTGFSGVLGYSLAEALWLVEHGIEDVLVAYPTVDREALRRLGSSPQAQRAIRLVVDDVAQLDLAEAVLPSDARVQVVIDVDAALLLGRARVGAARSPIHSPADAAALARAIESRPWAQVVGVMVYDAQIAGQSDNIVMRHVKRVSLAELAPRRAAIVDAVQSVVPGRRLVVNAGGTGSLHLMASDPVVTELAAGSGLFAPTLFDAYDAFDLTPAAFFAVPVVRRTGPASVTVFAGGYAASGPHGRSRSPKPVCPAGLRLVPWEGAGEVQTPLVGPGARGLAIGDRVWFRHAKAGEMCERFPEVHVVDTDGTIETHPTYRGEGQSFG